jgi:hypothetical protein
MTSLDHIITYSIAQETISFEETYDVEFPEEASLEDQIKFVIDTEDEEYDIDQESSRHILYHLLSAQMEQLTIIAHLEEVGEFLHGCREDKNDLPIAVQNADLIYQLKD